MVGRAVIALLVCLVVPARALAQHAPSLSLPDCAPGHVDLALLRELLGIEIATIAPHAIDVTVSPAICDPTNDAIVIEIDDRVDDVHARDAVVVPDEPDPESRARAMALAMSERARLALALAAAERARPTAALGVPPPLPEDEDATAAPRSDPARPADTPALSIAATAQVRALPSAPTWSLGPGLDVRARFDDVWVLRGALAGTWTRASVVEGDIDLGILDAVVAFGPRLAHDAFFDLDLAARAALGVLIATGTPAVPQPPITTASLWCSVGLELALVWWIAPDVGWTFDLAGSGLIAGTRIVNPETLGTQLELTWFVLDVGTGVRVSI